MIIVVIVTDLRTYLSTYKHTNAAALPTRLYLYISHFI